MLNLGPHLLHDNHLKNLNKIFDRLCLTPSNNCMIYEESMIKVKSVTGKILFKL